MELSLVKRVKIKSLSLRLSMIFLTTTHSTGKLTSISKLNDKVQETA